MKKLLKKILLVVLALVVIALLYVFLEPLTEKISSGPADDSESWMARLGDDVLISDISIPGANDSATQYVQLAFFSKCQSLSVGEQLRDGCRYLDIRLGLNKSGDDLIFYHGFCKCKTGFLPWERDLEIGDVLERCYVFLKEHPTETIIFAVKQERGDDTAAFQTVLQRYIELGPGMWYLSDSIPRLGECRGKLVLMRRYEDALSLGSASGIQLFWTDQGGNSDTSLNAAEEPQDSYVLSVQDRYKYSASDKWSAFKAAFGASGGADLRINFLSTNGTPKFGHPFTYAKILNKNLLSENISGLPKSWIILDFVNAELAEHVYDINFR